MIKTKLASYSHVMFVTHQSFCRSLCLPSCCISDTVYHGFVKFLFQWISCWSVFQFCSFQLQAVNINIIYLVVTRIWNSYDMDKLFSWDNILFHWFQQSASLECYYKCQNFCKGLHWVLGQFLICILKTSWIYHFNPRNQPTFQDATTGFPTKWRGRNKFRNSILITCDYPALGSDSDWSYCKGSLLQAIRSTIPWSG